MTKRMLFSWFVGLLMPVLLVLASIAWLLEPGVLTFIAAAVVLVLHVAFWAGAGRAIFDAYLRGWRREIERRRDGAQDRQD